MTGEQSAVRRSLDARLASYAAALGATAVGASQAGAVVVGNSTLQPFGVNGEVSIDFNSDGQTDFQIDHDRVNLNGNDLDYLQIDKNDVNGAANPLAVDPLAGFQAATFPPGATVPNANNDAGYLITGTQGSYPAALVQGAPIGPASTFDYQEGDNFQSSGKTIRANRLLDEDATQIDQILGGKAPAQVQVPFSGPNFLSLAGQDRYVGVRMQLNGSSQFNYGWIGVRITNEADATGAVTGWGYETTPGAPISAGVVPEPTALASAALGAAILGARLFRRRS